VLALPAIQALSRAFEGSPACVVGNEVARHVVSLSGMDLDFVYFDRRASRSAAGGPGRGGGDGSWRGAVAALRKRRWAVAVTFAESFSSALLLKLAGARRVVGYNADARRLLLSDALRRERLGMRPHLVREFMALAQAAGAEPADERPALVISRGVFSRSRAILGSAGLRPEGPLVGICPGAAYGPAKMWSPEKFAGVARTMAAAGFSVAVFGSASEVELARRVAGETRGVASLAGVTTVSELAGCLALCSVVIANDSGAAHLAAAAGTPVVAIFGSTDASWTRPLGPRTVVVTARDVPCAPCFGKRCDRGYECLSGISEETVAEAARSLAAAR